MGLFAIIGLLSLPSSLPVDLFFGLFIPEACAYTGQCCTLGRTMGLHAWAESTLSCPAGVHGSVMDSGKAGLPLI